MRNCFFFYLDLGRVLVRCLRGEDSENVRHAAGDQELDITARVVQVVLVRQMDSQRGVLGVSALIVRL